MAERMKVGIIGVGGIGNVHADAYNTCGQAEIRAICDIVPNKLATVGNRLNVAGRFEDYKDLLKSDIDAVSICTPNYLHCEMALAAIKAGKHVLLEKPMAMNSQEAAKIVAAAKKAKTTVQIGMVWRQAPHAQVVREYVEKGEFGTVYHMRAVMIRRRGIPGMGGWFTTKAQSGGGPMIDLGVHWFDLSMWMSGLWKPTSVSAKTFAVFGPRMKNYKYVGMWAGPPNFNGVYDVEDYSTGFVRFGDKATLNFDIAWAANATSDTYIDIMGDKGGARLDGEGKTLNIMTEHEGRPADLSPQYASNVNRFANEMSAFVAACRGEREPAATAEQGLVVMKLIDAIYESSKTGKEVAIKA